MSMVGNSLTFDVGLICKELRDCRSNDTLDEKRRQQLRANCHELCQLEKHLKSAVHFKELREQQRNEAKSKEKESLTKLEENAKFDAEIERIHKTILQEQELERKKKVNLLEMFKLQINDLQQTRRAHIECIQKDNHEMEMLLKKVEADKLAERIKAEQRHAKYRKEMEDSYRNNKLKDQMEKERNVEELQISLAYKQKCTILDIQIAEERKRIQKEKEEVSARIGKEIYALNQEKEQQERLLLSLSLEERKWKDDLLYKEAIIRKIHEREKLRTDIENSKEIKKRKDIQFEEEEEKFRKEHLRYLEERDKLNQLSDEKRLRKKIEHRKSLKEMVEIRRFQKAHEIAERIAEFEKITNEERERNKSISMEGLRMLCAVPQELLRYIPQGVLRRYDKEFLTAYGESLVLN